MGRANAGSRLYLSLSFHQLLECQGGHQGFSSLALYHYIIIIIIVIVISIAKRCSYNSPTQRSHPTQSNPTYSSEARKTHDVIYFLKRKSYKDLKNNVPKVKNKNLENLENLENLKNLKNQKPKKPKKTKKNKKTKKTKKQKKTK